MGTKTGADNIPNPCHLCLRGLLLLESQNAQSHHRQPRIRHRRPAQEANAQLEMLVACENKLRELQRDVMITQTARNAYANALKSLLPTPLETAMSQGDVLKLN